MGEKGVCVSVCVCHSARDIAKTLMWKPGAAQPSTLPLCKGDWEGVDG